MLRNLQEPSPHHKEVDFTCACVNGSLGRKGPRSEKQLESLSGFACNASMATTSTEMDFAISIRREVELSFVSLSCYLLASGISGCCCTYTAFALRLCETRLQVAHVLGGYHN